MSVQEDRLDQILELLRIEKGTDPAMLMKSCYDLGVEYQRGRIPVGTMMRLRHLPLPSEEFIQRRLSDLFRKTEKKWLVSFAEASVRYLKGAFDLGMRDERARVREHLKYDVPDRQGRF